MNLGVPPAREKLAWVGCYTCSPRACGLPFRPLTQLTIRLLLYFSYDYLLLLLNLLGMFFRSVCFLLVLIVSAQPAIAQKKLKDYKWPEPAKTSVIPDRYKNEDAIYTLYERKYVIDRDGIAFHTVHFKVKILTKEGLSRFAKFTFPNWAYIETLDARSIKPDGRVVDLNAKDITMERRSVDYYDDSLKLSSFTVSDVEVGDELEVLFIELNVRPEYYLYMHMAIPVMHASYTLRIPYNIVFDFYLYNGMEKPQISEDKFKTYSWAMDTLPGFGNDYHSVKALILPYVVQVWQKASYNKYTDEMYVHGSKWENYLKHTQEAITHDAGMRIDKYAELTENYIKRTVGKDATTTLKMNAMQQYLNDSVPVRVKWDGDVDGGITYQSLLKVYIEIFKDLNIPYRLVLARDRYNGPFDYNQVGSVQVDSRMFAFDDGKGGLGFLAPHDFKKTFLLNEIPLDYQNTQAIVINVSDLAVGKLVLPISPAVDNSLTRKAQVNVSLDTKTLNTKMQETFKGNFSTLHRSQYWYHGKTNSVLAYKQMVIKTKYPKAVIDTAYMDNIATPTDNQFKVMYNFHVPNCINDIGDKKYSINMESWFWQNIDNVGAGKRTLDYYPMTSGSDVFKYYLVFDHKVELVNKTNLDLSVSYPEYGMCNFTATQVDSNTVLVESNFTLSGKTIPVADLTKFAEMKMAFEKSNNQQLVVKQLD